MLVEMIDAMANTVTIDPNNLKFSGDTTTLAFVNSIWSLFALLGVGLSIIYFLIEMNRKLALEGHDLSIKSAFAPFLKLMIAIVVLSKAPDIVGWIMGWGDKLIDEVNSIISADTELGGGAYDDIKKEVESLGLIDSVLIFLPLLIAWIVSMVCSLIWWYKTISYKIEVYFRVAISPVAYADIYSGQNSTAIRWTKGWIGTMLYGMAFLVIPNIVTRLVADMSISFVTDSTLWGLVKSVFYALIAPIAALGTLSVAKQLTKEVI